MRVGLRGALLGGAIVALALASWACGAQNGGEQELAARAQAVVAQPWTALGDELVKTPSVWVTSPSLAGGDTLAWSEEESVYVRRWSPQSGSWLDLSGADADVVAGNTPSVAVSSGGATFLCHISGSFVDVQQWTAGAWASVGGAPVDILTLQADLQYRYMAEYCSIAVNALGEPVVAWVVYDGVKHHTAYAARWSQGAWHLLENRISGDRATSVQLVLDAQGRPYVVTYEPDGSYGGHATTRVFRWRSTDWQELGEWDGTDVPSLAVSGNAVFVAMLAEDEETGDVRPRVLRSGLNGGSWRELPGGPGTWGDEAPVVAVAPDGAPWVAFVRAGAVQVMAFRAGKWTAVGAPIPTGGGYIYNLQLGFTADGRGTLAWLEQQYGDTGWLYSIRVYGQPGPSQL